MTDLMSDQLSLFDMDPEPQKDTGSSKDVYRLKEQKVRLRLEEGPGLYSAKRLSSPYDAVDVMARVLKEMDREYMVVVNMNNRGQPLGYSVVSMGTLNSSIIGISEIFKTAVLSNAGSIMMMHNHPTGTLEALEPSDADLDITRQVAYAGRLMGIKLVDHIIVSGDYTLSLRNEYPEAGWDSFSNREFERLFKSPGKTM